MDLNSFQNVTIWLGGLFNPEAYITATRQCVAQANSWSLEELTLEVSIADSEGQVTAAGGFNIKGKGLFYILFFANDVKKISLFLFLHTSAHSLCSLKLKLTKTFSLLTLCISLSSFVGLKLQGALCKNNELHLTPTIMTELAMVTLQWVHLESTETDKITLPVYLNATRTDLLFTVDLTMGANQSTHSFYERGVALLTSTSLN